MAHPRPRPLREADIFIDAPEPAPGALYQHVRDTLRARHYSRRTEEAYLGWIHRFVVFHGVRHPATMGSPEIRAYLTHLAVERRVSAATQSQALAALLFLYDKVLRIDLDDLQQIPRAKKPRRLPVVLTRDEVRRLLDTMTGTPRLVALLLYGSGLRLLEALTLRVKDVDLETAEITVRRGKGNKDRVTMLPALARAPLVPHLDKVRALHRKHDVHVALPDALARKSPNASREWPHFWLL